ncbi:MAG: DJ-1/PfpI family protein [Candidatus Margulisbacteria bacterium]|nr:DJ-1/PfpI family protein [Candidatus Margulisiibacteriota bacterium]
MPKIAIIIAFQRFRDEEFFVPYELFIKEKYQVTVFSSQKGIATGKLGKNFNVEHTIDELNVSGYDAVMFVGGSGGYDYIGNETIKKIIIETVAQNKYLTAICMAPLLLAQSGVMKGKKSTVFYDEKDNIGKYEAIYIDKPVVTDGKIITGNGPAAAKAFAETIISRLHGS